MSDKTKTVLTNIALALSCLALFALVATGFGAIGKLIRDRAPDRVVYVSEVSGPPQGAEVYGFFELIYFYDGQGYRAQFFTLAERNAFEREYLPTLGRVVGPRMDMSALPQDPGDAVGRAGR